MSLRISDPADDSYSAPAAPGNIADGRVAAFAEQTSTIPDAIALKIVSAALQEDEVIAGYDLGETAFVPGFGLDSAADMASAHGFPGVRPLREQRNRVDERSVQPGSAGDESLFASIGAANDFDASILADFIAESRDCLRGAEAALLQLETDPTAAEPINVVFRAFHTIKGTASFLDLPQISEIAHHAESLLQRFREGELRCTGPRADLALRSVDMLQALLNGIETESLLGECAPQPAGYDDLICDLEELPIEVLTEQDDKPQKIRLGDILVRDGLISPKIEWIASSS